MKNLKIISTMAFISMICILNFNILTKKVNISKLKLNDLFTQATAACEDPTDAYSSSRSSTDWVMALPFYESYNKSSSTTSYAGSDGCVCTETNSHTGCSGTFDINSFCNPVSSWSVNCS